ncbi:unnamed protein product [Nippostrongylus brasiliensis]|uniref:ATP-dependent NAD(P)H-hydrate dehydratase n=1 Tax=Nippostrongylus brasiliensis TaxID=27835 RepID=A0A0N4YZV9_NIPBR|nr:unnamed protein product [Nippostrongylus brasiliensis]
MPALPSAILTPNMVEFSRLCESALDVRDVLSITDQQQLQKLATSLSEQLGISVFLKGREDIIANPDGEGTELISQHHYRQLLTLFQWRLGTMKAVQEDVVVREML